MNKRLPARIWAVLLLIVLGIALGVIAANINMPKVKAESIQSYTITTDNRQTRGGADVTCFVLRVDGAPVDLSCMGEPLQMIPFDELQAEPGTGEY